MTRKITIQELLNEAEKPIVLDVRTPAEFAQGHIPGAVNLPLFSNEERVIVGTTYKQTGREAAILLGFELVGPKWAGFIRGALDLAKTKRLTLHCWRGGMRSGAMAWALDLYGFKVQLLEGGYKRYRRWVLDQFGSDWPLWVLGGMTGSGKTKILHRLRSLGEQVIDLEDLVQHCGSSFGSLNKLVQPTQEQFENELAAQLHGCNKAKRIWVEDESLNIGKRMIPKPFWDAMGKAILFDLQIPADQRVQALVEEYGSLDPAFLSECTQRIWKRLGSGQTKNALKAIEEGRMADFIREVLVYYDKTYARGMERRRPDQVVVLRSRDGDIEKNTDSLLRAAESLPAEMDK